MGYVHTIDHSGIFEILGVSLNDLVFAKNSFRNKRIKIMCFMNSESALDFYFLSQSWFLLSQDLTMKNKHTRSAGEEKPTLYSTCL